MRTILLGFSAVLLTSLVPGTALPNTSTFKSEILGKPLLPQPDNPFVTIFFHGGDDTSDYGFTVDGTIVEEDWRQIFRHTGYIAPYAPIKPDAPDQWRTHHYDVALRAAQSLGRYSGGSIMGIPTTAFARANLQAAYQAALFLRMTHFFHDDENDPGTPGGGGISRLRILRNRLGATFVTRSALENPIHIPGDFTLSLGVYVGDYVFGGDATILTLYSVNDDKPSWLLRFHNEGGYGGKNYFEVFTPEGRRLQSVALTSDQAARWQTIRLLVKDGGQSGLSSVVLSLGGFGTTTINTQRVAAISSGLSIGDKNGYKADIDIDDISLQTLTGKELAVYDFEAPARYDGYARDFPTTLRDNSGNGHDLEAPGQPRAAAQLWPTTGIDPQLSASVRIWLIDSLLDARHRAQMPEPILLTNWSLSDRPGRFGNWSALGFNHGSTEYYLFGAPDPNESNLVRIFRTRTERVQWAWLDGSKWTHAWIGNGSSSVNVLSPRDYLSLITLAVLDGNRWFSVFTAMSHGHLGRDTDSRRMGAIANADSLYNMALAASWFQSTSESLRNSIYLGDQPLKSSRSAVIFRSRINPMTLEMWFAASLVDKAGTAMRITVALPTRNGTLTNLATQVKQHVGDGTAQLSVQELAQPMHFLPDP
jgi:hypothetical protein